MNVSKYIYIYIVIWSPSKQALCRFNAGPSPTTPVRHQISTANANTSCLFNSSSHHHGPAQQTRDADPTPGRRLVPAWRESERPYTYKANRDIRPPGSMLVHRLRQWTSIEPARYTGD